MNQNNKNQVNSNSFSMDLESLRQKYSNLLIQYKAAVADYVNYLNQNSQQPYGNEDNSYIILGVGTDGKLYSRPGLDTPWSLVDDNSNTGVITIFTGNDGKTIYCTNKNKEITYKSSWDAPTWQGPISDSCCVLSATMGQDGTIVGIGKDNKLYSRPLDGKWKQTASSGEWASYVAIAPDGSIFVVGGGNKIYKKNSYKILTGQDWKSMGDSSCCVKAITIAPDGTFIGIGTDNQLYTKASYKDLSTSWQGPYNSQNSSCCVTSITTIANPNYNSSASNYKINREQYTSLQGMAFNGSGTAGQSDATTLQECEASCANLSNCTGATFVSEKCLVRTGDSPIVPELAG